MGNCDVKLGERSAASRSNAEWQRLYDDLQKRVTRFSVVEQELINTRDRLDRELDRFGRIQEFNTRAIHARSESAFSTALAESIVDIFELEFGLVWFESNSPIAIPSSGTPDPLAQARERRVSSLVKPPRRTSTARGAQGITPFRETGPAPSFAAGAGLSLTFSSAESFGTWVQTRLCSHQFTGPILLEPEDLRDVRGWSTVQQLVIAACRDVSGTPIAYLAGGITDAGSDFHEKMGSTLLEPFEVFTQQVSALIENRRYHGIIERQIEEIELSGKRLNLALNASSVGLWDWNITEGTVFYSPQWCDLFGEEVDTITHSPQEWHRRVHPQDLPGLLVSFDAHLEKQSEQFEHIHRMRHRDGSYRWMLTRGRALPTSNGGSLRVVGTHVDISEQKTLERRLREAEENQRSAREQAEAASRAKSDFLATMSHEIRTPLNGVLGAIQLLRDTSLQSGQNHLVDLAEKSATILLDLIGDVLDLSKVESGKLELDLRPVDLRRILDDVVSSFLPLATASGLSLTLRSSPTLPQTVNADPMRLRQILNNLIGNAIKFTRQGGVVVSAQVTREDSGTGWVEFAVIDTGLGIPAEIQKKLFSAFVQADTSTTRRYGGTGLGLAISRRLVELMGGEIRVSSVPGEGSEFRFQVPLQMVTLEAENLETVRGPGGFRGTALVAEDDPIGQKIAPPMLRKLGLEVDVASNGREAVNRFEERHYDVIFMDCNMPELDGYAAAQEIRRREASRIPNGTGGAWIIALTANAMAGERAHCLSVGMNDYLTKPFRLEQLQVVLNRAVRSGALVNCVQPPRPEATLDPTLQTETLTQLCTDVDPAGVLEIVEGFCDGLKARPLEMRQLLVEGRHAELETAAHSVKGMSSQLGLIRLSNAARSIELTAKDQNATHLDAEVNAFTAIAAEAVEALHHWLEQRPHRSGSAGHSASF